MTFQIANSIIDFCFFLDICINFRTVYIDDLGNEYNKSSDIARFYLRHAFILDLLATIPFDDILQFSKSYQDYVANLKKNQESQWV